MKRHKPGKKRRTNSRATSGKAAAPPPSLRDRLGDLAEAALTAVVGLLAKAGTRVKSTWESLRQWQKIAFGSVLVALTLPALLYCSWIMLTRGRYILLIRVAGVGVYSEFAWFVTFMLSIGSMAVLGGSLPAPKKRPGAKRKPNFKLPGQDIGLLPRARWLYVRGQHTRAQTLLDALLAREPDNAAALELQALNARQRAQREEQPATPPPTAPDLLDSNFPSLATRLLVAVVVCFDLWGAAAYARIGLEQGWNTTVWSGVTKYGNTYQQSALSAAFWLSIFGLLCLLYLISDIRGVQAGPIIEANVSRAAKWLHKIFRRS